MGAKLSRTRAMLGLRLRKLQVLPAGEAAGSLRCAPGRPLTDPVPPLRFHGRYPYSPITRRPDHAWPNSRPPAVQAGFNVEHFAFGAGLGACIGPKSHEPDVLNYSWRDYGNRVGVWRCLDLFGQLGVRVGAIINTSLYDYCPEVIEACVKRGDELIGH